MVSDKINLQIKGKEFLDLWCYSKLDALSKYELNEKEGKLGVTLNNGCYEWVTRSIKPQGNALFAEEPKVKPWKYFNGGFQITNKKHIPFYTKVQEYYTSNINTINKLKN